MARFIPSQYSEGEEGGTPVDPNAIAGAASSVVNLIGGLVELFGGKKKSQNEARVYQAQMQASLAQAQIEQQKAAQTALLVKGAIGVAALAVFGGLAFYAVKTLTAED